jgi:hypothetical protein
MRLTIACPAALIADANDLAMALAFGPADARTYGPADWQDPAGNLYAVASFEARPEWMAAAQEALARPAWDAGADDFAVNMTSAARAQGRLRVVGFDLDGVAVDPAATPDLITSMPGPDGPAALAAMGLALVPVDPI